MFSTLRRMDFKKPETLIPVAQANKDSVVVAVGQNALTTSSWLTKGKQERAFYITGAALLTTAAVASYVFAGPVISVACVVASFVARILPIPLAALAVASAWTAFTIIDYDNPVELARCKEEAKSMPLCEIFKKHPNGRAGSYKIITQEQFTQKYIKESSKLKTVSDIAKYRYSITGTNGFFQFPSS